MNTSTDKTGTAPLVGQAPPSSLERLRWVLTAFIVLGIPVHVAQFSRPGLPGFVQLVFVGGLVALVPLSLPSALRLVRRRPPLAAIWTAWSLVLVMVVATIANGTQRGVMVTAFALGAAALAASVATMDRGTFRRFVAIPLLATASIQAGLVAVQSLTGEPWGLDLLDPSATLATIDGILRPQGTLQHVYYAAALASLAVGVGIAALPARGRWRPLWLIALGINASAIGFAHSRAALLGLVVAVGILITAALRGRRSLAAPIAAIVLGFAVAALLAAPGWSARWQHTATSDLDRASLGRITLIRQAAEMIGDHPLVGVGPGRYMDVLEADYEVDEDHPFVVNNVPMMVAAETGVVAAVLITLLLAWSAFQATRAGPVKIALFALIAGFLLFDVLHYEHPIGLVMMGVWLGTLASPIGTDRAERTPADTTYP